MKILVLGEKKVSSLTCIEIISFQENINLIKFILLNIDYFFQPPTQIVLLKNTVNKSTKAIIIEKSFFYINININISW